MILNDKQLRQLCQQEGLVDPYDDALINPASIDLRLGGQVRFPKHEWRTLYAMVGINGKKASNLSPETSADVWNEILNNMWDEPVQYKVGDWFWVEPGDFILCHSLETVRIPETACAFLYSKSSMGRIGLEHLHSGFGDPKFIGQWTWELSNSAPWPIRLQVGKRYMQMVLAEMEAPSASYQLTGRYMNQKGATPAREFGG